MGGYRLYGSEGSGSMIVEAGFALAGEDYERVEVAWEDTGWESKALADLNPLGQLPTLVLPDGSVMTETAAILLHLHDVNPGAGLVPTVNHPGRTRFLRFLAFLVAAVYPTFTYGDVPERWVGGDRDAAARLRDGTDAHRCDLLVWLAGEAGDPWFLGDTWSAIDLYLWAMSYWRPGRGWWAREVPALWAIAERTRALPALAEVLARHPPPGA